MIPRPVSLAFSQTEVRLYNYHLQLVLASKEHIPQFNNKINSHFWINLTFKLL